MCAGRDIWKVCLEIWQLFLFGFVDEMNLRDASHSSLLGAGVIDWVLYFLFSIQQKPFKFIHLPSFFMGVYSLCDRRFAIIKRGGQTSSNHHGLFILNHVANIFDKPLHFGILLYAFGNLVDAIKHCAVVSSAEGLADLGQAQFRHISQ